ncbi:MAG: hypothetical protein WC774_01765 [Candidatus Gracilibacteria bacterium]|jgi:hypothetical protein
MIEETLQHIPFAHELQNNLDIFNLGINRSPEISERIAYLAANIVRDPIVKIAILHHDKKSQILKPACEA